MKPAARYIAQGLAYGLLAAFIGTFANYPAYTHFPADRALIKLSFSHGAQRKAECRRLSPEELARLAPNMRKPVQCERERLPVAVELTVDGATLYRASVPPSGLAGDGPARMYRRFAVAPGTHRVTMRLRDTARADGYDYERSETVELAAGQSFAIDFRNDLGIVFR
jgi:hypothetical protein